MRIMKDISKSHWVVIKLDDLSYKAGHGLYGEVSKHTKTFAPWDGKGESIGISFHTLSCFDDASAMAAEIIDGMESEYGVTEVRALVLTQPEHLKICTQNDEYEAGRELLSMKGVDYSRLALTMPINESIPEFYRVANSLKFAIIGDTGRLVTDVSEKDFRIVEL